MGKFRPAENRSIKYAEDLARKAGLHWEYDWADIREWDNDEILFLIDYFKDEIRGKKLVFST